MKKIMIPVTRKLFGYIELEIDDDSPLLDADKPVTQKHRIARQMGELAVKTGAEIHWTEDVTDENPEVSCGYTVI